MTDIPGKGRGIISNEPIQRGDLITEDEALAIAINDGWKGRCCEWCLKTVKCEFPCEDCGVAFFCSEQCRDTALEKYHDEECYCLCRAIPNPVPPTVRQALQGILWTNKTGRSDFFDFHGSIHSLSTGMQQRVRQRGKLLRWMLGDDIMPELSDDEVASAIVKVMQNCLAVPSSSSSEKCVGAGMFPYFAKLNHDCIPCCESFFEGRICRMMSVRDYPIRHELSSRYTNGGGFEMRKEELDYYGFDCLCEMCDLKNPQARLYEGLMTGALCECRVTSSDPLIQAAMKIHQNFKNDCVTLEDCILFSEAAGGALEILRNLSCGKYTTIEIPGDTLDSNIGNSILSLHGSERVICEDCKTDNTERLKNLEKRCSKLLEQADGSFSFIIQFKMFLDEFKALEAELPTSHTIISIAALAASQEIVRGKLNVPLSIIGNVFSGEGTHEIGDEEEDKIQKLRRVRAACIFMLRRVINDLVTYPQGLSRLNTLDHIVKLIDECFGELNINKKIENRSTNDCNNSSILVAECGTKIENEIVEYLRNLRLDCLNLRLKRYIEMKMGNSPFALKLKLQLLEE